MIEELQLIARLMAKVQLSVVEAMCMSDLIFEKPVSWTFAPAALKRKLRPLIDWRKLIVIRQVTFEGDTQVYEFLAISDTGAKVIGALSK